MYVYVCMYVGYKFCLTADNLYIAVLLRLVLFPLIVCSVKQVVFTHDFFSVLFVLLLGFTNGYLGSVSILVINEGLDEKDRGLAGILRKHICLSMCVCVYACNLNSLGTICMNE